MAGTEDDKTALAALVKENMKMKVVELRARLTSLNGDTKGVKAVLAERLANLEVESKKKDEESLVKEVETPAEASKVDAAPTIKVRGRGASTDSQSEEVVVKRTIPDARIIATDRETSSRDVVMKVGNEGSSSDTRSSTKRKIDDRNSPSVKLAHASTTSKNNDNGSSSSNSNSNNSNNNNNSSNNGGDDDSQTVTFVSNKRQKQEDDKDKAPQIVKQQQQSEKPLPTPPTSSSLSPVALRKPLPPPPRSSSSSANEQKRKPLPPPPGSSSTTTTTSSTQRGPPPASAIPPTPYLRVRGFVRPFTLQAAKARMEKATTTTTTGGGVDSVVKFWMDSIRTHALVEYSSVELATAARNNLHGLVWPKANGSKLEVEFVVRNDVAIQFGYPVEAQPLRQRQPSQSAVRKEDPVVLDNLFNRTESYPRIYWKPACELPKKEEKQEDSGDVGSEDDSDGDHDSDSDDASDEEDKKR
eukprot:TRINITY_DN1026_c0_g1_i1.p1 TRINITY_DN1026_c0_g1~~TRINITY_DN1026_c0_g1_i1.p1  ORF type:complete len:471 (-),score=155.17 TRINITY_DN1026_c0_g1_i1:101-1513(-)